MKYTYSKDFAANGKDVYREHYARVRQRMVNAHREAEYLEFNVEDGWEPLCKFLGKEIPTDADGKPKPFPKVNDRAKFEQIFNSIIEKLSKRMLWTGMACLILVAAVGWAWWRRNEM
jgi:Sulfotransferase domain